MVEAGDESTCREDGCPGVRFDRFPECFAHLGPTARTEALARLRPGADLDLRHTTLTAAHLDQLLTAVHDGDHPVLGSARFDGARFTDRADLRGLLARSYVQFTGARFDAGCTFEDAVFEATASFRRATFAGRADFAKAWFHGLALFLGAVFEDRALFVDAVFERDAGFGAARFEQEVAFDRARFADDLSLENTWFRDEATFTAARFERVESLGPFLADRVELDRALFAEAVTVDAKANRIMLTGTRLDAGAVLRLEDATVWLDGAILGGTTAIVGADIPLEVDEAPTVRRDDRASILGTAAIASIRGVDASRLVLSGVDLTNCRFSAAYQLDQLRIEGRCRFGTSPRGVRFRRGWPPVWWWTRRQTIIEEHRWRARQEGRPEGWTAYYPEGPRSMGWRQPTHPERVAALYRQLRKAFEDAKNEPGAADFYYGEMEMRRIGPSTPAAERLILTLYWLLSGYGLRAGRALVGLVALVGITTGLLAAHGFADPGANTENALRTALNAVVFRSTTEELTTTGAYVELVARALGPILLALAALSVRNRVKR